MLVALLWQHEPRVHFLVTEGGEGPLARAQHPCPAAWREGRKEPLDWGQGQQLWAHSCAEGGKDLEKWIFPVPDTEGALWVSESSACSPQSQPGRLLPAMWMQPAWYQGRGWRVWWARYRQQIAATAATPLHVLASSTVPKGQLLKWGSHGSWCTSHWQGSRIWEPKQPGWGANAGGIWVQDPYPASPEAPFQRMGTGPLSGSGDLTPGKPQSAPTRVPELQSIVGQGPEEAPAQASSQRLCRGMEEPLAKGQGEGFCHHCRPGWETASSLPLHEFFAPGLQYYQ